MGENTEINHNNSKAYTPTMHLHVKEQVLKHKAKAAYSWHAKNKANSAWPAVYFKA